MFDFGARLVAIGLLILISGATGSVPFADAVGACAVEAVVAGVAYLFSERKLMNAGLAGLFAILESGVLAYFIARSGTLPILGILVLAPCILATTEYRARAIFMAPVAAACLLGAAAFVDHSAPSTPTYLHVAAVLAIGLLLEQRKPHGEITDNDGIAESIGSETSGLDPIADLELRETFRKLRDAYRALETSSRRDRTAVELSESRSAPAAEVAGRLAMRIGTLSGARAVVIYTVSSFGSNMVVKACHGDVPMVQQETSIDVDPRQSLINIVDRGTLATRALREDQAPVASIPLVHHGHVVGLISLSHTNSARVEEARLIVEDAAEEICEILLDARQREDVDRRLREAELLYDLKALAEGVESAESVSKRFASELKQMLNADHVGVFMIDGTRSRVIAEVGHSVRLVEEMSFANGSGVSGWLATDAPELLMHEVRKDARCSALVAVKARVGSFLLVPLEGENGVQGYVSVASSIAGSLGKEAAETTRVASLELARALFPGSRSEIMLPSEFHRHIQERSGYVVWLQPLGRTELEIQFGRPAMAHVIRRLTGRIKLRLPREGALCRRTEGDFVAFLPDASESEARAWANETVAYASMLGLRTPDGTHVVPLAVRAKVAQIHKHNHEFLQEMSA